MTCEESSEIKSEVKDNFMLAVYQIEDDFNLTELHRESNLMNSEVDIVDLDE